VTLEDLEKRMRAFEDIEEIKKLHRQYAYWLNAHQWDEMIDCFTEDALADIGQHGPHKGRKEITELFKVKIAKVNENWNSGHFVTEPIISVEGDRATGSWILYIFVFHGNKPNEPAYTWFQGRHDCEYVKINGKWKYKYIKFTAPWPEQIKLY
jgi:ketosteroid isomerase-like protein